MKEPLYLKEKMIKKIPISIGIAAYNEAQNIKRLLLSLLNQHFKSASLSEIIVVSSGSTDFTNRVVKNLTREYPIIKLLRQKKRMGKASAVNLILKRAKEDIIVLCSADILIPKTTLDQLIKPFRQKSVGIVGSHPVPLNNKNTFFGYTAHLLWNLHHTISLSSPKMGECIAFRKVFKQIPIFSAVDEVSIESVVKGQGYRAVYIPDAIIYNMGAVNLTDFITRRRHIYAGHLAAKYEYSYVVSTLSGIKIFFILLKKFRFDWQFLLWTPLIISLEVYSRFLGLFDYKLKLRNHTVWDITKTTKKLPSGLWNE